MRNAAAAAADDGTNDLLYEIPAPCSVSREAVEEREEFGEIGCPICGRSAGSHRSERRVALTSPEART